MSQMSENNNRIVKNTLMLYVRMLLLMAVTFYTSRVVLDKLGIIDYGIYNIVGGIVSMLGFLTNAMANAVQRFLSFEMGRGDSESVNHIFNVSLIAHYGIALFMFVVMEFVGVWYLNTYINLPLDRLSAANWVLQCSIITTVFSIIQVPYNAIIISYEQMSVYAYISILEAILRLAIVFLLMIGGFDKLKFYSVLVMLTSIVILIIYRIYCVRTYKEARFHFVKDFKTLKRMTRFASWNMIGELAWVFTGQGVNIILNLFFGPVVNAARGLADQVGAAVMKFVGNFQTAINPQLIKSYAVAQFDDVKQLLYRSIRFSFYLMFILSLPLLLKMDFVMHLWLKDVPDYTIGFCQLVLVAGLVSTLSNPLSQVARASGHVRKYQICVSGVLFLNFPLSYLALKIGASPYLTVGINVCIQTLLLFVRIHLIKGVINLQIFDFIKRVLWPICKVLIISIILPCICSYMVNNDWIGFIITGVISLMCSISTILIWGVNGHERTYIRNMAKRFLPKYL